VFLSISDYGEYRPVYKEYVALLTVIYSNGLQKCCNLLVFLILVNEIHTNDDSVAKTGISRTQ